MGVNYGPELCLEIAVIACVVFVVVGVDNYGAVQSIDMPDPFFFDSGSAGVDHGVAYVKRMRFVQGPAPEKSEMLSIPENSYRSILGIADHSKPKMSFAAAYSSISSASA